MRVEYIRVVDRLTLSVGVKLDTEERVIFSVLSEFFDAGTLAEGCELGDENYARLVYEDERYRATRVALKLLIIADCSKAGLFKKLRIRKFSKEISSDVVKYIASLGYIREEEQIKRLILTLANRQLYGERSILPRLAKRYYDIELCERILSSLVESGEIDFSENARALIEKKLPSSDNEKEIARLLYNFGYNLEEYEND